MASSLPPPAPPYAGDPLAVTIPPPLPSPAPPSTSLNLSPALLVIGALLAFVFCASVSIHFLLRCLSRQPSPPAPSLLPRVHSASSPSEAEAAAPSPRPAAGAAGTEEVDDEKERLIASLPLFTMASALAALPKSSPDCAVCLSAFQPDAELRLLPACRHAFHAACVDAWLRTTPSCPLCRAGISLPHPPLPAVYTAAEQQGPLDSMSSRSFRVEIGSISNRRSSAAGDDRRTYSLGSFDYRVDEEVEAVVARIARPAAAAKSSAAAGPRTGTAPQGPGEALAEAAGSRGWLREYVDRLASSASSLSGRWSARWSQSHHSHRQEAESWRWDPEAAMPGLQAADQDESGLIGLYRWIVGV
ncbi:unnamed protein product [Alopecurus aequalis]